MILPRALDPFERWWWTLGRVGAGNMLMVAHGRGTPDLVGLRSAAAAAQRRHPFLRARLDEAPGGPRFVFDAAPLDVRALPGPVRDAWGAAAEAELRERFPAEGPLVRLSLLRDREAWALLIGFDHAATDGVRVPELVRDLLSTMAGAPPGPVLPATPPLTEVLPPAARDPALAARAREEALARAAQEASEPPLDLAEGTAAPTEKRTRAIHLRVPARAYAGLEARCSAERTTVQGALAAALLLALREEVGLDGTHRMSCTHGVDLRPWLTFDLGDGLGNYAVPVQTHQRVGPASTLWPLARDVKDARAHVLERGAQWVAAQPPTLDPATALDLLARWRPRTPGIGVTDLGRLGAPAKYGAVTWEGFSAIPALNVFGGLAFAEAAALNGNFEVNLVHAEPVTSRARAERLAAGMLAHLGVADGALTIA